MNSLTFVQFEKIRGTPPNSLTENTFAEDKNAF